MRKLHGNLVNVLEAAALDAIRAEIDANVSQLYALGRAHFQFARRLRTRDWRQKVSRLYYAAYNVSRAIRLCVHGEYSMDASDHRKIEALPDDFPNRATYANRLSVLREDRNLCDYDHSTERADLVIGVDASELMVSNFLLDTKKYLRNRGVRV